MKHPVVKKNKAVFLDRDGVLNREIGTYVYRLDDFVINEGVIDALQLFQRKNLMLFIITNQSGVAKGIYSHQDIGMIHNHLKQILQSNGIYLTEIYYCPHHPDFSRCLCRKPDSLMLEKAIARFNIDVTQSFFIGDKERDIASGQKVGLRSIKIIPNENLLKTEIVALLNG